MAQRAEFLRVYRERLEQARLAHPDEYTWPLSELDVVYGRMVPAIDRGTFNKDSRTFRNTCRELGIRHTYKAIAAYIGS